MRWAILTLTLLAPAVASAQEHGAYGRLQGDLTLEGAVGGGVTFAGDALDAVSGAGAAELRARYLDMAGLMAGVEIRPEGASRGLLMADLRPLFFGRFILGATFGDRYWDVLLDSIGIDLGLAVTPLEEGAGVAFAIGFGVDVPLVFFDAGISGISLRLFGRHVAAAETDRFGPNAGVSDWIAGGMLVFRGQVATGLPGWEPRRYRLRASE